MLGFLAAAGVVAAPCPAPKAAKDVLRCAVDRAPETLRAEAARDVADANIEAAGQLQNPTLSVQSGFLTFNGERRGDHQLALTQPLDWGGKRGAEKRAAEARRKLAELDVKRARAEVAYETLLKLHRARQLQEEQRHLDEAAATFGKLVRLHAARPSLTPEQQVSLSVFRMAKGDLELQLSTLAEEASELARYFERRADVAYADVLRALPPRPESWPVLDDKPAGETYGVLEARLGVETSLAEDAAASAESWPLLSAGPYALLQSENDVGRNLYGFMVNIELPILSWDGGIREVARRGVARAERNAVLARREADGERAHLVRLYEPLRKTLDEAVAFAESERGHERMEKLFLRGVVPSTLVIESHRQFLELMKTRNERELRLLQIWWRLRWLAGALPEEVI